MTGARRTAIMVSLVVASTTACKQKESTGEEAAQAVVNAQTVVVTPQAFTETIGALGIVVARAGHVATLSAPEAGHVGRVLVTAGQAVTAGQSLVELDQAPFTATLQSANATLAAAERANERQQRLAQEGIVPRKDAEQAAAELAKAQAEASAARRNAQLSVLHAPIGGVVTRMSATIGASVDPAQPLVEISDPRSLDILLNVTPTDAANVRPGAKVALSAGQNAAGEPLGVGTVSDVSSTVDSVTRSVAVRVQAATTRRPLRIGETVNGAIAVATRASAIVIPPDALVPEGEEFKVFVVDGNGIAHERDVKVGGRSAAGVEITEGLKAGERVVTYGAYGMQDSVKVVPLTPQKASPSAVPPNKPAAKP
jgi:membrane fusion protein (multidrug efflux system)